MTAMELFIWACEHHVENKPLYVGYRDSGGSYEEYDNDLKPEAETIDGVDAVII